MYMTSQLDKLLGIRHITLQMMNGKGSEAYNYSVIISLCHNILVRNKLLHQMKINKDALCTCNKIQQFIRSVVACLNAFNIQCDISEKYFLFGLQEEHKFTKVSNFIVTICKVLYISV